MKALRSFLKKYDHIIFLMLFFAVTLTVLFSDLLTRRRGEVVINEVCTSNFSGPEDEKGKHPDWVELYNVSGKDMDISGYILSKSVTPDKEMYVVPDGTVMEAGSFFLFNPGFSLSSKGCTLSLFDRNRVYADRLTVPALDTDTSYGRESDGGKRACVMESTPGYTNETAALLPGRAEGYVTASVSPGFYPEAFSLRLSVPGALRRIYYTLDGTDPSKYGRLYDSPILIEDPSDLDNKYSAIREVSPEYMDGSVSPQSSPVDKCVVVRAVARDILGRDTAAVSFPYFVGYDEKKAYDGMTVVSAVADPDDLFSYDRGIMVLGSLYDAYGGSFDDWGWDTENDPRAGFEQRGRYAERPADICIFNEEHLPVLTSGAGIRVKGLSSRRDPQKSFNIFFRKTYGESRKMSFETDGTSFDLHSLSLDKFGQDTDARIRDVIMQECMKDTGCATVKCVPCCLFLNGEYWGFYWLTERLDDTYFEDRYGVAGDSVQILDKQTEGDFAEGSDWEEEHFDRDSLLEYYAANIITAHTDDWPDYNVRFWRSLPEDGDNAEENRDGTGADDDSDDGDGEDEVYREDQVDRGYSDGKLRPIIFDMNSDSMYKADLEEFDVLMNMFYPFRLLTDEDPDFRRDLVAKIDEMRDNEFRSEKVLSMIDAFHDRIRDQMILDHMRYYDSSPEEAAESFDGSVDSVRSFFESRWDYLSEYEQNYLDGVYDQ